MSKLFTLQIMRLFAFLITLLSIPYNTLASKPLEWQLNFQEAATPVMEQLHEFHNFLLIISTIIVAFVFFLIIYVLVRFNAKLNPIPAKFSENYTIEIIWTIIPIIILIIIAIPSFRILKFAEKIPETDMTIKVVGSQWYWTYSYPDHGGFEFDSNIIQTKDLLPDQLRLLEVDNRLVIPEGATVKFLITGADAIHSFFVPSFGMKTDAVPGRLNETWIKVEKQGVYYGQCAELCGVNHGFMPIVIEVVSKDSFDKWIMESKTKFGSNSIGKKTTLSLADNR